MRRDNIRVPQIVVTPEKMRRAMARAAKNAATRVQWVDRLPPGMTDIRGALCDERTVHRAGENPARPTKSNPERANMNTNDNQIVAYVAGPFRADSAWGIEQNIRRAEDAALFLWRNGLPTICPHTNTRFFQGAAPDHVWLEGDLDILLRCDVLFALWPQCKESTGALKEIRLAYHWGIIAYALYRDDYSWQPAKLLLQDAQKDAEEMCLFVGDDCEIDDVRATCEDEARVKREKGMEECLVVLSRITGIHWRWYYGVYGNGVELQLMPETRDPKSNCSFWRWYVTNKRQWFKDQHEAVTALLDAWLSYSPEKGR